MRKLCGTRDREMRMAIENRPVRLCRGSAIDMTELGRRMPKARSHDHIITFTGVHGEQQVRAGSTMPQMTANPAGP